MSSASDTGNEDAGAHAVASAGPGARSASSQESLCTRPHVMLALKLLAGMLIIAAPALVMNSFLPGFFSVAFYGVLAASFAWVSGGPKIAAIVVASLSIIAIFVIWQREHLAVLAAVLILLGIGYGYASSRGIGKALLQLPILAPYFMMASPPLFSDPPTHDLRYLIGFVLTMNAMGLWTILVLHFAVGRRTLTVTPVIDRRVPLITGTLLGVVSAAVMLVALTSGLKMHWVWVTLTLYLLVEPTQRLTSKHTFGRVLGTFAGFGLVAVLTLIGVPDAVLQVLAIPAAWMCLFFLVMKRPYSQYSFFLTVAVVGMNQRGVNTLLIDAERFVFTIVGALLAVLIAALTNLLVKEPAAGIEPSGDKLTA